MDAVEISKILLTKCHPETTTLDGRIVLDQTLQLLVVHQIALATTDVRVGEFLVNLQRLSLNPFTIFVIKTLLSDLTDVDFRIEVCGKSLMVITGIAVYNVEILYLVEMMLGSISGEDARYTRVNPQPKIAVRPACSNFSL